MYFRKFGILKKVLLSIYASNLKYYINASLNRNKKVAQ